MKKRSFSVLFYTRKTRWNKTGEAPILLRITVNGQREELRIHRFINPRLWNTAKGKATENGKACKELNLYLSATVYFLAIRGLPYRSRTYSFFVSLFFGIFLLFRRLFRYDPLGRSASALFLHGV